jgi:phosphate transport system protein
MRAEKPRRVALGEGLAKLNENMITLAEISEMAIRKAMGGLLESDLSQAEEVSTLDREIYALQNVIEKNCIDLIALHAPVAKDLRTITTSLKIVTDLDRIGRYARDIAEVVPELSRAGENVPRDEAKLKRMADLTIHMVDTAIRAFTNHDAASVRDIAEFDNAVDDLYEALYEGYVHGITEGTLRPQVGVQLILVSRYLERIADHAVNVGRRVVYMETGEGPAGTPRSSRPGPELPTGVG